jgi:Carboxypeptidase regulatory-like domain/TonB dependent receptor-like, beta-barrel/TonB-dependent Receptor Plug Domain
MRFPRMVPLYVCLTLSSLHLLAQSPDGNINGLVSDPSSAAVAGAEVVAVNDVTRVQYTTKTNTEGIYVLPNLPPGPYRLQVSKIGFKTIIKPEIVLDVQSALSINFTLPIGAAFEIVTVEGGASMINTTDASVSTVVDQAYVKNMPLNGRSFQDLILLTPGVVTNSPQGNTGGEFSVNGQRTEANNYTVDGVSANVGVTAGGPAGASMVAGPGASGSLAASTALGTTQALVSVDDLLEFRVQSSTYSAEYGRNPGGQFSFETKSGANQWQGTAYDYLRNGVFDAQDWFNDYFDTPEPALRQNDFGGTLGGPLEIPGLYQGKDKTFFFVSYEGLRLSAPQAATASFVPDLCLRGEAAKCTGTNAPAPVSLQSALNAFPAPSPTGIDDTENGIAQFIGSWSNPSSLNATSVRFDHVVNNDKLRLFFRFSDTSSSMSSRGTSSTFSTPSAHQISDYVMRTYTLGATSTLINSLSNSFRLNYSSNEAAASIGIDAFGGSTPVDLRELSHLAPSSRAAVQLSYGGYDFELQQLLSSGAQRQWNLTDALNLSVGRHQLKLGVDYRRLTPISVSAPSATFIYLSRSAVEMNDGTQILLSYSPAYPLFTNFSAYGQDEWRISQRLSLSLGLRWDVNPPPGITRGLQPYTLEGSDPNTWTLGPPGTPLWHTTWHNFAPRLGVAYILRNTPGWQTVVRGGTGVFFDTGQQLGAGGFEELGYFALTCCPSGAFPGLAAPLPAITNPPTPPYTSAVYGIYPHLQLPYTLQWNVSIEQALENSQTLAVSYVGAHAARLLQYNYYSPVPANPDFTQGAFLVSNGLTSDYDALQVQFRRSLWRGLTALASYTWSHCLDYGSANLGSNGFVYQRGNCDFDVRHNLSAAFSYDLPRFGQSAFARSVFQHWGLDDRFTARTAFPVTLLGNYLLQPTGLSYNGGLNLVPGQPIYLYGSRCASALQGLGDLMAGQGCPGGRAINPNAFVTVDSGLGSAPRNFARGFGAWQMDLAVRRDFPIHERLQLQFRVEAFNILNHPNFGTINPYFGQTTFGQATAGLASSLGVLSPLYQQGGPRSMQFALKFTF